MKLVKGVNRKILHTKLDVFIENERQNFPDSVVQLLAGVGYDINSVQQPVLGEADKVVQKHDMHGVCSVRATYEY